MNTVAKRVVARFITGQEDDQIRREVIREFKRNTKYTGGAGFGHGMDLLRGGAERAAANKNHMQAAILYSHACDAYAAAGKVGPAKKCITLYKEQLRLEIERRKAEAAKGEAV